MHVCDEVAVDVDANDAVVGVEFLLAPVEIEAQARAALFKRFPVVRKALADFGAAVA